MASVGLYDMDMTNYVHVPFNLEIMKLAQYFKRKRLITTLNTKFHPDYYSSYYVRKDYNDGDFPLELYSSDHIDLGGFAFTNGIYVPLPPEIERAAPDKSVYNVFSKRFCANKTLSNVFKRMMNAEHLRLSQDGKTVADGFDRNVNYNIPHYSLYFHDFDLNSIKDSDLVVKEIIKKCKNHGIDVSIGNKFPIQAYTPEELAKWSMFSFLNQNFSITYNGILDDESFYELIVNRKDNGLFNQLNYVVTYGCSSENDFIINRLPQIYNQAIFSRINRVRIVLKYEDNFFVDKRWERVIRLINAFIKNIFSVRVTNERLMWRAIELETMYSFVKALKEPRFKNETFTKDELRELFQFVRENNYEVFKDFYEKSKVILEGGQLVNGTTVH